MKNTGRRIQGMQTDILKAQQTTNEYERFGNTTLLQDDKNLKKIPLEPKPTNRTMSASLFQMMLHNMDIYKQEPT